ncbi:4Fe-4S binding protein [Clostridium magnum]|uniref:Putative electron transport protein YccM n=1 Tax=Clostridium magnum DSM 2767 TaxID=1121326 RepID=A0A168DVX3_9CLOT|nr:4Fe-4S binding protein [Clostridium magnum]KZL91534.1 putative electron transport protein YccM [Clostridium magnum DSM 2767]SHH46479.1 4Fe-4S binding domain-containing protein [Clostridium magnum DSM 2767]
MKNKLVKSLRYVILAAVLIFVTIQSYLHAAIGGKDYASIHALCPYGALESLYSLIFNGTFIQKIFSSTFILLGLTLILALIFRRSFCGLICPFGTIQELFGKLGKKLFKKRFELPKKIDNPLRYLKYVVLFVTLYYGWKTAGLWMSPYDPWAAYGHVIEGPVALIEEFPVGSILLLVTIIGSLLYDRFFCKYLCPMGAFYGILSKVSPSKITRDENTCVNCGLCNKNCPANIKVSEMKTIKSAECLNCQSCIFSCPKKNTLKFKFLGKGIAPLTVLVIVVSIFFGGIGITKLTNVYQTTPAPVTSSKTLNPEEIKGYMTIQEVATALKMDIGELYKKLNIPTTVPKETKLKDVKSFVPDFEVETARESLK